MMSVFQTGCFYVSVALLSLLFCWQSEKSGRKTGLVLSVGVLSLAAGLRAFSVGVDTLPYLSGVEYFVQYGETHWQYGFSYGYGVFCKAVLYACDDFTFLLFVEALITNGLIAARFWDYRNGSSLTFMMLVYVCTTYLMTLCLTCQFIAVSIVFYCSRFLDNGKVFWYCVGVLFASAIHLSALIAIIPMLVRLLNFKEASAGKAFVQLTALAVFLCLGAYAASLLFERYSSYANISRVSSIGFMVFAQAAILFVSLLASGYFAKGDAEDSTASLRATLKAEAPYAVPLYLLAIVLSGASYVIDNAGRIAYYFTVFGPVVFGAMAKGASCSKERFLCAFALIVWFVAYGTYVFFLHDSLGIFPYSFCWA